MISYLRTVFSLDLRSLALLRILLASLILVQIWALFPDAEALLSDSGVLPRDVLLEKNRPAWALSLYMMMETPFQVRILMLFHAAVAIGLLLGLQTRWCAVASWILLMSLHNRNPWILNGGDTLMSVLSFWILFLPVHARASLDRLLSRNPPDYGKLYFDVPSAALILQICMIYWSTVFFKTDPVWWNGEAVRITLESDQFVKPFGIFLRGFPQLHAPLTWVTVLWESAGPLLLMIPIANAWMRMAAVFGFTLFHLGLEFTMELGLFPAACIVAWLTLLPTLFWERATRIIPRNRIQYLCHLLRRLDLRPGPLPHRPGVVVRVLVVVAFLYVVMWNLRNHDFELAERLLPNQVNAPGYLLKIRQKWSMFSPGPPRVDGWFVMRARQFNSEEIDLLADGAPLTWDKPELVVAQFPNRRWGKYFSNIRNSRHRDLRRPLGDYLIKRWNSQVDVGYQVREAELYFMLERTLDDGIAEPEKRRLWYRKNIRATLR